MDVKRAGIAKFNHNKNAAPEMALLKENKQLKSMLLLHLNVIQEQNDMLVAKDKQIASLQSKLDRLEKRYAGQKPASPSLIVPGQDENTPNANNTPTALAGVVPSASIGSTPGITQGNIRPVTQQLSRGTIMRMAALNQASGKGQLRIRPLMISLKKVMPAVIDQQQGQTGQQQQQEFLQSQSWSQFLTSHKIKTEQVELKNDIQSMPIVNLDALRMTTQTIKPMTVQPAVVDEKPIKIEECTSNGNGVAVGGGEGGGGADLLEVLDDEEEEEEEDDSKETGGSLLLMDVDSPEIIVSDGSPVEDDLPMELKIDEDDDALSPVKCNNNSRSNNSNAEDANQEQPLQRKQTPSPLPPATRETRRNSPSSSSSSSSSSVSGSVLKVESPAAIKVELQPLTSESLAKMRFEVVTPATTTISSASAVGHQTLHTRTPSECSNRAPRKYSRVMSTRKLYVTRHWEEEVDVEEPNSLVVPELREGEENLEVPNWKEIDALGLEEEILGEEAPKMILSTEDLSAAAFLKRHAKHEADERRRKKWDIQRFREQRTIEKLKKRQCKSDIYSIGGGGGGVGGIEDDQSNAAFPMSLYPNLSSIRHVETTEYLPVQAFGEPIPTLHTVEFNLPWQGRERGSGDGGSGDGDGLIEFMQDAVGGGGGGGQQLQLGGSSSSSSCLGTSLVAPGEPISKYSSFYVKQSSMPIRLSSTTSSSSNNAKYRFKRVKSQGSSSGRR